MNGKRIATNDNITKKSYMTAYQSYMKQKSKVAYIFIRRYGMSRIAKITNIGSITTVYQYCIS